MSGSVVFLATSSRRSRRGLIFPEGVIASTFVNQSHRTTHHTAHLRRGYVFGGIIPLRSKPSRVYFKESTHAADFARSAPKRELLPKASCSPTRYASHPLPALSQRERECGRY